MGRDAATTERLRNLISRIESQTESGGLHWERQVGSAHRYARLHNNLLILGPATPLIDATVPLFKRLEPHELEHLAEDVDQVNYAAGATIFNEHDLGDGLYVVETGSVRIWVMDEDVNEVTLAELKPGDFFGELAVLDRGERSSSATALTDTHLHKLSSDAFQKFLIEHSDA